MGYKEGRIGYTIEGNTVKNARLRGITANRYHRCLVLAFFLLLQVMFHFYKDSTSAGLITLLYCSTLVIKKCYRTGILYLRLEAVNIAAERREHSSADINCTTHVYGAITGRGRDGGRGGASVCGGRSGGRSGGRGDSLPRSLGRPWGRPARREGGGWGRRRRGKRSGRGAWASGRPQRNRIGCINAWWTIFSPATPRGRPPLKGVEQHVTFPRLGQWAGVLRDGAVVQFPVFTGGHNGR